MFDAWFGMWHALLVPTLGYRLCGVLYTLLPFSFIHASASVLTKLFRGPLTKNVLSVIASAT